MILTVETEVLREKADQVLLSPP